MNALKIMLVDDDQTTLDILAAALEQRGHEVIERDTAIGTALACSREKPDVLVLDVNMPGLSGNRLAGVIMARRGQTVPLIVLHSSTERAELVQLARRCGACGIIEKSGDPARFVRSLEELVVANRKPVEQSQGQPRPADSLENGTTKNG